MTATAHALVAGAIASSVPDPVLAPILAFSSHFILDAIPHWDIGTNWRTRSKSATGQIAILDTLLGITLAYFLFAGKAPPLMLLTTIIASELPDWLEAPWYMFFATHDKKQPGKNAGIWENLTYGIYKIENLFHAKAQFPFGLFTQIAAVSFFLVLLHP
ncbi:hypothetical protein A2Z00_02830 [Candidatus Gottesmanbacteria bacterium RBG_13_45_10]|uniref:Uncharacterized protein n=1 Tax=Candidatus Gottesmanbacteria bacterium RBG_13_45_10 TaxID=1798370 RepID=A0A1F5ZG28_9BACT|nr:MAG: hypothetical protein A2Z00_02830 [Candidatus Gottesmanbacteria bacterium RBG_13_45_10]